MGTLSLALVVCLCGVQLMWNPLPRMSQGTQVDSFYNRSSYGDHYGGHHIRPFTSSSPSDPRYSSAFHPKSLLESIRSGLMTRDQLLEWLKDSASMQIHRAADMNAKAGTDVGGDAALRNSIRNHLTLQQQRDIYRHVVTNGHTRVASLFGAPPYAFLAQGEASLLDAAGVAAGRVNMSYKNPNFIPNYSQFGVGTCSDQEGREYRLHTRVGDDDGSKIVRLGIDAVRVATEHSYDGSCELVCRIPRSNKNKKRQREDDSFVESPNFADEDGHTKRLPMMNSIIVLKDTIASKVRSKELVQEHISLQVRGVTSATPNSSTGIVRVVRAGVRM